MLVRVAKTVCEGKEKVEDKNLKAVFIGKDSMGFKCGNIYDIYSKIQTIRKCRNVFEEDMNCICIYDRNSRSWCPYQNLESVLENWKFE